MNAEQRKKTYGEAHYIKHQFHNMQLHWKSLSTDEKRSELVAKRTRCEVILEEALRKEGISYSLQFPFMGYFLDFKLTPYQIAVEVDGGSHCYRDVRTKAEIRAKYLSRAKWTVLRFTNRQIRTETSVVLQIIKAAIAERESWKTPAIAAAVFTNRVVVVPPQI